MNQVYRVESNRIDRSEVIRISDEYWNEYVSEFLKDKESFDKQMIEFLKNVHDIHYRNNIVIRTPLLSSCIRDILHTFTIHNNIYLQTEEAFCPYISLTYYPMLITFVKKPDIHKTNEWVVNKRKRDELEYPAPRKGHSQFYSF